MIFRQYEQVLNGKKTQTRRLIKPNELASGSRGGSRPKIHAVWIDTKDVHDRRHECQGFIRCSLVVLESLYRLKWHVAMGFYANKTYAVQPGRGKKAVGRIRITKIKRERVQDISLEDVFAEGVGICVDGQLYPITTLDVAREEFARLWNSIYAGTEFEFIANPEVWVLIFELVDSSAGMEG